VKWPLLVLVFLAGLAAVLAGRTKAPRFKALLIISPFVAGFAVAIFLLSACITSTAAARMATLPNAPNGLDLWKLQQICTVRMECSRSYQQRQVTGISSHKHPAVTRKRP
jgi:hypothetical protein